MIDTYTIADVTICVTEINEEADMTRRRREQLAVRRILQSVLGDVTLNHTEAGAPYIIDGPHISISHSRNLAVVAYCHAHPVGIDAETWRPTIQKVSTRYLSETEQGMFSAPEQMLAAWTVKEAVYKLAGIPAVDFAASISISPDMKSARVGDTTYTLHTFTHLGNTITLAVTG